MFRHAQRILQFWFMAILFAWPIAGFSQEAPITQSLEPTTKRSNQIELTLVEGKEWQAKTTGADPYFFIEAPPGQPIDLTKTPILSFEYFCAGGIGSSLIFVGQDLNANHLLTVESLGKKEGWATASIDLTATISPPAKPVTSLRLRLGQNAGITAKLRNFAARPYNHEEASAVQQRQARADADKLRTTRLKTYLQKEFPSTISTVEIGKSAVEIQGAVGPNDEQLKLQEVPMWMDVTNLKQDANAFPISAKAGEHFHFSVPRIDTHNKDRMSSGWVLVRENGTELEPASAMHYGEFPQQGSSSAASSRDALKGLGGCPVESPDMIELGVKSITLNFMLTHFVKPEKTPNCIPWNYAGQTWQMSQGAIAGYDRMLKLAAERHCTVAAIILLPHTPDAPAGSWIAQASDPDADSGCAYVMPNFTTQAGVEAYAAVMSFLADRYGRPDGEHGRIHNWILHNEINSGFYWTSAGRKSVVTYMDAYQKSMRLAKLFASQFDPNAKPLISLDHSWTDIPDPRSYAGKEMLELLAAFSKKEGDFNWGIAFHPYAQDLRKPRTWEDEHATFSFDTKLITFKNLEVLDAWAQLPAVQFLGKTPRKIQLTEQGLNSPDYSETSLRDQAAGMAYAWKKVQPLKTITAFQYHLWADDHSEGGLRLGLRKYGDDAQDPHGKKPIWELFKALGTDQEDAACSFALPVIGIKSWSEIHHSEPIR